MRFIRHLLKMKTDQELLEKHDWLSGILTNCVISESGNRIKVGSTGKTWDVKKWKQLVEDEILTREKAKSDTVQVLHNIRIENDKFIDELKPDELMKKLEKIIKKMGIKDDKEII